MKVLRFFALLLVVAGIVGVLPAAVFAADPTPTPTPLTLEITSPANKTTVTTKTITITGKVSDPNAKVTIQGDTVKPAANGTFSGSADLSSGINGILVEAMLPGQLPVDQSLTVTYNAPLELDISAKFPKVETVSGSSAAFDVVVKLNGGLLTDKPVPFDLVATAPKDWTVTITPQYPTDKKIASIQLTPGYGVGENIVVSVTPSLWLAPEPGNYPVTLAVNSPNLKGTLELTAVVKAKYTLSLTPENSRYNTTATAGQDNPFSFTIDNIGSAAVNNINLSADKPTDWKVEFKPNKVDNLASGSSQTIDVTINPGAKAIAGDYLVTLKVSGTQTTAPDMQLRVTVETPTVWGWVGVIIVVVVIGGLVLTFRQFSRR